MTGMENYHNKFKGTRCFIVGNGPSLKDTPLESLVDEYTFGMNRIAMLYGSTAWRAKIYLCASTLYKEKNYREDALRAIDAAWMAFLDDYHYLDDARHELPGDLAHLHYIYCSQWEDLKRDQIQDDWWSDDITERVCKYGSTAIPALQIAAYMGFNPIYLLGMDLGYKQYDDGIDTCHFNDKYNAQPNNMMVVDEDMNQIAGHEMAKHNTDRLGVSVYNATLGGLLEVYPRIDLEAVLG